MFQTTTANALSVGEKHIFVGCVGGVVRVFATATLSYLTTVPCPHHLGIDLAGTPRSAVYPTLNDTYRSAIYPTLANTLRSGMYGYPESVNRYRTSLFREFNHSIVVLCRVNHQQICGVNARCGDFVVYTWRDP